MHRRRKIWLFALLAAATLLIAIGRPVLHVLRTAYFDRNRVEKLPAGYADDVSRMNKTPIAEAFDIPPDLQDAEPRLRELLMRAQASGLHVSIAGARHSMGGQTIYPDGISVNMLPLKGMELDATKNLLHVQAGARWADVIPYLDRRGRSIEVMQSDNAFTVGGSLSVNCHGWQYGRPPIASTVESFRLMRADGTVVRCSRSENPELFSLAAVTGSSASSSMPTFASCPTNGCALSNISFRWTRPWLRWSGVFVKSPGSGWSTPD